MLYEHVKSWITLNFLFAEANHASKITQQWKCTLFWPISPSGTTVFQYVWWCNGLFALNNFLSLLTHGFIFLLGDTCNKNYIGALHNLDKFKYFMIFWCHVIPFCSGWMQAPIPLHVWSEWWDVLQHLCRTLCASCCWLSRPMQGSGSWKRWVCQLECCAGLIGRPKPFSSKLD